MRRRVRLKVKQIEQNQFGKKYRATVAKKKTHFKSFLFPPATVPHKREQNFTRVCLRAWESKRANGNNNNNNKSRNTRLTPQTDNKNFTLTRARTNTAWAPPTARARRTASILLFCASRANTWQYALTLTHKHTQYVNYMKKQWLRILNRG